MTRQLLANNHPFKQDVDHLCVQRKVEREILFAIHHIYIYSKIHPAAQGSDYTDSEAK